MKPCSANDTGRPSFTTTVDGVAIACSETSSACSDEVAMRQMSPTSTQAEERNFRANPNVGTNGNADDRSRPAVEICCSGFLALRLNIQGGVSVLVGSCAPLGPAGNRNVGRGRRGACESTATATAFTT